MEKDEWRNNCRRIFSTLVRGILWKDFRFPAGGRVDRVMASCHERLLGALGAIGRERIADFCITQAYAISRLDASYRRRWDITHSFGEKAVVRYLSANRGRRYHEDRWLKENGFSRADLAAMAADRSRHPFERFIYPEYEERTKRRLLSTGAGYAVCALSTLLWTPFSPSCRQCAHAEKCRQRTAAHFPELYRIRLEASRKEESE